MSCRRISPHRTLLRAVKPYREAPGGILFEACGTPYGASCTRRWRDIKAGDASLTKKKKITHRTTRCMPRRGGPIRLPDLFQMVSKADVYYSRQNHDSPIVSSIPSPSPKSEEHNLTRFCIVLLLPHRVGKTTRTRRHSFRLVTAAMSRCHCRRSGPARSFRSARRGRNVSGCRKNQTRANGERATSNSQGPGQ